MPNMTKPYAFIEEEIGRLKVAQDKANDEAKRKTLEAEIHMFNRIELESALENQKKMDEERGKT